MPKSEGEGGAGRAGEEGDKISPAAGRKERLLKLAEPKNLVRGREGGREGQVFGGHVWHYGCM